MAPQAVPHLLLGLDFALEEPKRVVITGAEKKNLLMSVHRVYQPNKVVLGTEGPVEPFAKTLKSEGKARAFVCTGTACRPPTDDPAVLIVSLK